MAKCTGCGAELPPDGFFCPQCGHRMTIEPVLPMSAVGVGTISDIQTIPGVGARKMAVLAEGERFHGRYTVERQLGAGAMGVVYSARDEVTGRTIALKLINPALADRPTAREKFVREGLMARDIRHANVVAMYDVGEAEGQVYLVMELLTGETLRKWLRRTLQEGRDIAFETARGIIREVLGGLAAAHATGVVHRDLKPENVILAGDPHTGNCGLKIVDFGIARAIGAGSHLTTTSSSTGTPLYMAPEQKTAADTVGPPADLYAVTAMLYELLIGVAPEGRWSAPSRERPDLPPGIDSVIETGLANRPRSRFQTADEYVKALDAVGLVPGGVQLDVPPPAPPPPPPEPPEDETEGKWDWLKARSPIWVLWSRMSKRQRWIWGAVGVLVLIGVLGQFIPQKKQGEQVVVGPGSEEGGGGNPGGGTPGGGTPGGGTPGGSAPGANAPGGKTSASGAPIGGVPGGETQAGKGETHGPVGRATLPPPPINIQGRWFDEVSGTGIGIGYVDIAQQEHQIAGAIYNAYNYQIGRLEGRVSASSLEYNYVASNGLTGTVRGSLTADGNHLELVAQNHQTGYTERHTLHRGHLPHQ